jgi:transcriptional regulator with XRE-family HTH domain
VTKMQFERLRRRWSQTDLAGQAKKLSSSDISRFERGYGRPYPSQAKRLGKALGLSPSELLEPMETEARAS